MRKRGQVWSFDLIVALVIFVIGLIIIYFYALNYKSSTSDSLGDLYYDATLASNIIISEDLAGLSSDNALNQTRIDMFDNLTNTEMKIRFGVSSNFYFIISDLVVSGNPQDRVGIVNTTTVNSLVKISRIVIYQNKPVKMEVIAWR